MKMPKTPRPRRPSPAGDVDTSPTCKHRHAFTMIEATVSVGILAILLVVALSVVGASTKNQYHTAQRATAALLAQSMLDEIMPLPYQDPATPAFGIESNESSTSKANYDDVDDFNGWTESPPQDKTGAAMTDLTGWTRSVSVAWVTPTNITQTSATETGVKRVTVTVSQKGIVLATRTALRGNYP